MILIYVLVCVVCFLFGGVAMALGIVALVERTKALLSKKNAQIVDLTTRLTASQANQVDPADVAAAVDLNATLTAEEAAA